MDEIKFVELEDMEMEEILKYLEQLSPESKEFTAALENYDKLRRLQNDIKKTDLEMEKIRQEIKKDYEEIKKINLEIINDEQKRKDEFFYKVAGYGIDMVKFGTALAVYCALYNVGLKFEETNTVSAHPLRDLIGSINPFRKK